MQGVRAGQRTIVQCRRVQVQLRPLTYSVHTISVRLLVPPLAASASPETSPTALSQNPRRYSVSIFSLGTPALMT